MKRSNFISAIVGALALLSPLACSEGPFAPARSPLEVRVLADTIAATMWESGAVRTANFTTVVELRNRSREDIVEFYLCGSIVLHERERMASFGGACPGIAVSPIVLQPGASTTLDHAHFLCLAGSCMRGDDPATLDAPYEIRVHYQAVRELPGVDGQTISRDEVARSNAFIVITPPTPAAGEFSLVAPLLLLP